MHLCPVGWVKFRTRPAGPASRVGVAIARIAPEPRPITPVDSILCTSAARPPPAARPGRETPLRAAEPARSDPDPGPYLRYWGCGTGQERFCSCAAPPIAGAGRGDHRRGLAGPGPPPHRETVCGASIATMVMVCVDPWVRRPSYGQGSVRLRIACVDPAKNLELMVKLGEAGVEQTRVDGRSHKLGTHGRESEQDLGDFLPERLRDRHVRLQSKVLVERGEPSRDRVRAQLHETQVLGHVCCVRYRPAAEHPAPPWRSRMLSEGVLARRRQSRHMQGP